MDSHSLITSLPELNPDSADSIEHFKEALQQVAMSLAVEDLGWKKIVGGDFRDDEGPDLDQIKEISRLSREMTAGNALINRGVDLRQSYVWSKILTVPGVDDAPGERRRGPRSKLESFVRNKVNQESVFAPGAQHRMEAALATDGCFLLMADEKSKTVRPFPITEVDAVYTNPEFVGEIWAYRRASVRIDENGNRQTDTKWYYTDNYTGPRKSRLGKDDTPVDKTKVVIDLWVNRQVGWAFGLPDVLPALLWARMYTELLHYGKIVNDALASFVAKVKVSKKSGADNVGIKAGKAGPGNTVAYGAGNEVDVFSTAGKTYDFDGIRPVAAQAATAMKVSLVHLLSDPGAAGSSYGSASNLDLPTKRAMVSRQNVWTNYLERVIQWGSGEQVNLEFPPLEDPDLYRQMQTAVMAWQTGLVHEDEARTSLLSAGGISPNHRNAPEGVMLPNNENSLARQDVDTDGHEASATGAQAASPDQGRSSGSGGAPEDVEHDID